MRKTRAGDRSADTQRMHTRPANAEVDDRLNQCRERKEGLASYRKRLRATQSAPKLLFI